MRNLTLLFLVICLSSCGIFRKVHKESKFDKVETSSYTKSDSSGTTIDRSVITVVEKADTEVVIPAKKIIQETYFNMDSLINGMTAVKNDLIDIRFILNPSTGILTTNALIKPQIIPFKIDRVTTRLNDIVQAAATSNKKVDKHKEAHESSVTDRTPKNTFWFVVMIICIIALLCYILYPFIRKFL